MLRALALVTLLAPASGCFGPGLDRCDAVDGTGNWVAIRAVWNGTGQAVPGACITATSDGATLSARADDLGIAILHLAEGTWDLRASTPKEGDRYCAHEGRRALEVTGSADVVVRIERDVLLCV